MLNAAILISILVAAFLPLVLVSGGWEGGREKARARRLAEARMGARLLRFDL